MSLWDNFKHINIGIMGCWKEKRESKKIKTYLKKIVTEHFPNLVKEMDIKVEEVQWVPNKMNLKKPIPRHIVTKMPKIKNKEY